MRWMTEAERDDSGVATIFVILAMAAVVVGAALAIDVGGYVVAARSAQNSADATVLAVATDCALTGAPIADYVAVPQGRPDHHRPGLRQRRSHDHRDEGRRRSPAGAERRRRQPESNGPMGNPRARRTRSRSSSPTVSSVRRLTGRDSHRCTSTTRSRRAGCSSLPGGFSQLDKADCSVPITAGGTVAGVNRVSAALQNKVACLTNPTARQLPRASSSFRSTTPRPARQPAARAKARIPIPGFAASR